MPEFLKEKSLFLDWLAVNLLLDRPIKTRQLALYESFASLGPENSGPIAIVRGS